MEAGKNCTVYYSLYLHRIFFTKIQRRCRQCSEWLSTYNKKCWSYSKVSTLPLGAKANSSAQP